MKILKIIILFISICLITISCDSGYDVNFRKVYYPLDELLEAPKVYYYKQFHNGRFHSKRYTIYSCHINGSDTILSMSTVNKDFILYEKWDMKVNKNSVRIVDQYLTNNGVDKKKFERKVYYAEGIGMCKFEILDKGVKIEIKLKKILNYADWLKLKEEATSNKQLQSG
ncbi:MAG: hypothetical protein MI922_27980 [Bacteroidales bacterium]|nr:hypothetical protein [Bacteroidales bacterium]